MGSTFDSTDLVQVQQAYFEERRKREKLEAELAAMKSAVVDASSKWREWEPSSRGTFDCLWCGATEFDGHRANCLWVRLRAIAWTQHEPESVERREGEL